MRTRRYLGSTPSESTEAMGKPHLVRQHRRNGPAFVRWRKTGPVPAPVSQQGRSASVE